MVVEKTRQAGLNWQRLGLRVAAPGQAHGNNLNLNGGLWHEVTLSG